MFNDEAFRGVYVDLLVGNELKRFPLETDSQRHEAVERIAAEGHSQIRASDGRTIYTRIHWALRASRLAEMDAAGGLDFRGDGISKPIYPTADARIEVLFPELDRAGAGAFFYQATINSILAGAYVEGLRRVGWDPWKPRRD